MINYYGSFKTYFYLKINFYFEFRIEVYHPNYLAKLNKVFDLADSINSLESYKVAREAFDNLPRSDCPDETRLSMIIHRKRREYESR